MLLARRQQNAGPQFVLWLRAMLKTSWRQMVSQQMRWDEVLVEETLHLMSRAYQRVTRFGFAHILGPVWGDTLKLRRAQCAVCDQRKLDDNGVARCHGHPTESGRCDCPQWYLWIFSWLWWQILMCRNRVCPLGRFGRTSKLRYIQLPLPSAGMSVGAPAEPPTPPERTGTQM